MYYLCLLETVLPHNIAKRTTHELSPPWKCLVQQPINSKYSRRDDFVALVMVADMATCSIMVPAPSTLSTIALLCSLCSDFYLVPIAPMTVIIGAGDGNGGGNDSSGNKGVLDAAATAMAAGSAAD